MASSRTQQEYVLKPSLVCTYDLNCCELLNFTIAHARKFRPSVFNVLYKNLQHFK